MSKCTMIFIKSLLSLLFVYSPEVKADIRLVMDVCGTNGELTASTIEKAAISRWPEDSEARLFWYILLCMESNFNPKAGPSSAGAIGIGQIMPEYAKEFAAYCNIPFAGTEELWDMEKNLAISSCRWKQLLDMFKGDISLSLAAYNAGAFSRAVRLIKDNKTRSVNRQTLGYLAHAFSIWQKVLTRRR